MDTLKEILNSIIKWIGPFGLVLTTLIVVLVWLTYDLLLHAPLSRTGLIGLIVFALLGVAVVKGVWDTLKRKGRRQDE